MRRSQLFQPQKRVGLYAVVINGRLQGVFEHLNAVIRGFMATRRPKITQVSDPTFINFSEANVADIDLDLDVTP